MSHLGPDGTRTYTSSVAECVDALLRAEQTRDPAVRAVLVHWTDKSQHTDSFAGDTHIDDVDPFALESAQWARSRNMPAGHISTALYAYPYQDNARERFRCTNYMPGQQDYI